MFFVPQLNVFEIDGDREIHHWSPTSEMYAAASQLFSAILNGYQAHTDVTCQRVVLGKTRTVCIYTFRLKRGDDTIHMPVLENPAVLRFVHTEPFHLVRLGVREKLAVFELA